MKKMNVNSTPSKEKVWMKFYSEEARSTKLPKCTAYQYVRENNKTDLMRLLLHITVPRSHIASLFSV